MIDPLAAVRRESELFGELVRGADMSVAVPSCPDWSLADLVWHLAEVQDFWGAIVEDLLQDPRDRTQPERPADDDLPAFFGERSARLVRALSDRKPTDVCWSWHAEGHNVGWVRRRQAHEALIHRVDAQLAVGMEHPVDAALADDGVDEILTSQIDGPVPEWGAVIDEDETAVIGATDTGGLWGLRFGRFQGTSPDSGNTYDLDTVRVIDIPIDPSVTIGGSAAELDLWLWGRSDGAGLRVDGDERLKDRLRQIAAEATQ